MKYINKYLVNVKTHTHAHLHAYTHMTCAHMHTHTHVDVTDDIADILKELDGLESKYYTLGIHLHLPPGKVEEIQENNPHNCSSALGQVVAEWLKMNYNIKLGRPTWAMLVKAVSALNIERARKIANNHKVMFFDYYHSCTIVMLS